MRTFTITREVSKTIDVEVDVDISLDDIAHEITHGDIKELCADFGITVVEPSESGDIDNEQLIERAYLAAKNMVELPEPLRDLFWRVHGRALA